LFTTPIYEALNDRGVTSYLFLVLLFGMIAIATIPREMEEVAAKT
jgi:hypothetical protein